MTTYACVSFDIAILVDEEWNVEWCCNLHYCNKMYIFDSKSGLVMTGMKAVKRQID